MSMAKSAIGLAIAGAGTFAAVRALENMDADSIREVGDKVRTTVSSVGDTLAGNEFVQDIAGKINSTKYGPQVLSFASGAKDTVSSGFTKFVDALADSREAAEANGTGLATEMTGRLTGLVADGFDFVTEKLQEAPSVGKQAVSWALGKAGLQVGLTEADVEEPAADAEMEI